MKKSKARSRVNDDIVRRAPFILMVVLIAFVLAALVGGELFGLYKLFWWWDDVLHTLSGAIVGLIGFLMVYFFNARHNMHLSPVFVAVFAFAFAMAAAVFWEIVEFTLDAVFGLHMQRWNLPPDAMLIGREYQGSGLRDTMSDIIVAWIGAAGAAVFAYYAYKHEKPTSLGVMRRIFPWLKRRSRSKRR